MSRFSSAQDWGNQLRLLVTNPYFWGGLGLLLVLALVIYFLFNSLLMPTYTRHDVAVTVPNVENRPFEEAAQVLRQHDLDVEREVQRYNPDVPRNIVLDQNPVPNATVKPGRRVYLTVNSGKTPMVKVPPVEGLSQREARNRMLNVGLKIKEMRPDSIPSPYENTITRQEPAVGDSLAKGSGVTLWYSTGLGDAYVTVPDVTDMTVKEAQQFLLERNLRPKLVGVRDTEAIVDKKVVRQSREPGTRVREGFEVRLYLEEEPEE